ELRVRRLACAGEAPAVSLTVPEQALVVERVKVLVQVGGDLVLRRRKHDVRHQVLEGFGLLLREGGQRQRVAERLDGEGERLAVRTAAGLEGAEVLARHRDSLTETGGMRLVLPDGGDVRCGQLVVLVDERLATGRRRLRGLLDLAARVRGPDGLLGPDALRGRLPLAPRAPRGGLRESEAVLGVSERLVDLVARARRVDVPAVLVGVD